MRLAYLFLANYADIAIDGRVNLLGADFDTFHLPVLPMIVPFFYVVGRVYFDPEEIQQDAPFHLHIIDPEGNLLAQPEITGTITPPVPSDPTMPSSSGLMFLILNCEFRRYGQYRIIFRLRGIPEVERLFRVQSHPPQRP